MDYSPWSCKSQTQLSDFHFISFISDDFFSERIIWIYLIVGMLFYYLPPSLSTIKKNNTIYFLCKSSQHVSVLVGPIKTKMKHLGYLINCP